MDYFENMMKTVFEDQYGWVAQSVKVELTKEEKRLTGKPSIPRPEIDLLILDFANNQVIAVEVKSYLDSGGVQFDDLKQEYKVTQGKYKLLTSTHYRKIVFSRLRTQLLKKGQIGSDTTFTVGLAAGKVHMGEQDKITELFDNKGWLFWSPEGIKKRVQALAQKGYDNNPYVMTAKVLGR